jgi:beta-galactosidase
MAAPAGFGSRRHYDFAHPGYREECRRIDRLLAERYGRHPSFGAWQTDNEYACHDTVLSYSAPPATPSANGSPAATRAPRP